MKIHTATFRKLLLSIILFSTVILFSSVQTFAQIQIEGAAAHWISNKLLLWDHNSDGKTFELRYSTDASIRTSEHGITGGKPLAVVPGPEPGNDLKYKFRHISGWPAFKVDATREQIMEAVKGQVVAIAYDAAGTPVAATNVQMPGLIDENFFYDGKLGLQYPDDRITATIWSPVAHDITLEIYNKNKEKIRSLQPVETHPETGTWHFTIGSQHDKHFYRFKIKTYHHENNRVNEYEVTDPYSVSLSTGSRYSQFIDLENDESLKPAGWDNMVKTLPDAVDITLYEAHIRDFSVMDNTVPQDYRGTFMAFTYNGKNGNELSIGMKHLQALQQAGLTHLHLLPLNDIATIIEDKSKRAEVLQPFRRLCNVTPHNLFELNCEEFGKTPILDVFGQMAEQNPVNTEIQRIYHTRAATPGLAAYDGFNWGYDPYHFNTPEGSYSTNPEGQVRILELREMVKALHEIGLKVVVDVVYNHTNASGLGEKSVLDKVVPGYYHRRNPVTGAVETSTCCENTAAEHKMMEKLMIDSILLWAKEYKIDSFRFDLMGHHPKSVMENIADALSELTPENDGVDGSKIYIYGEGWDFGEVAGNRIFEQATQFNMGGTGIGNFNDRIRDAIRGGNFTDQGRNQGFANGRFLFPNEASGSTGDDKNELLNFADRIRVGMAGNLSTYEYENRFGEIVNGANEAIGYTLDPAESVNYIDKHDNETLWDNTQAKLPAGLDMETRVRIHLLSNAFINYGQGVPFYQMGTDILRSKSMDRNSYDSGDWFNSVDFSLNSTNWGIGLPRADENKSRWDLMEHFLTNPKIRPEKEHLETSHHLFTEQLNIRYSSPLFRLKSGEEVNSRVAFHNTGPEQVPGLIVMTISDGTCTDQDLDPQRNGILTIINAGLDEKQFPVDIPGLQLHPLIAGGRDQMARNATIENGVITIPGLTAAVFEQPQHSGRSNFPCNPQMGKVKEPGSGIYFKKPGHWGSSVYLLPGDESSVNENGRMVMALIKNGWYFTRMPDNTFESVIRFSDGNNNMTEAVNQSGDGCYQPGQVSWNPISECDLPGITVAFKKPEGWSSPIHVYTFGPEQNGSWPGDPMKAIDKEWYIFEFEDGIYSTDIIFNDNAGNQTPDLFTEGGGCYVSGRWLKECEYTKE